MVTVTTQLILVFLKKEISNVFYRGNTALLSVIVTCVSAFSVSHLASWRAYLVLLHSQTAETYAYSTNIDINNYFYLFTWITFAWNITNFVHRYTDMYVYSKFSVTQCCSFTLKPIFFFQIIFWFSRSPSTFLTVLFQLKTKQFHSVVCLTTVHNLFRSEFSTEISLVLALSTSTILSFPEDNLVAAYVFYLNLLPFLSFLLYSSNEVF